ncbi:vitamin B12-dependent ribonucleotide reductase [Elysia marginata]|uniref:Vitamin B12-dependent ribonucleotide reductase n=1 Tax=Elysia marginata TaxID=1093978 RepID=A0AAV4F671_9GAST|nr:vitamin B12-dependent ribonucleotide reductase [Elysia marginata]
MLVHQCGGSFLPQSNSTCCHDNNSGNHSTSNSPAEDRGRVISYFNSLKSKDEQDALLASFISAHPVERRRNRKENLEQAEFHKSSYKYHFNVLRDGQSSRVDVCMKGFTSMFGVTENRIRRIRDSILVTGLLPKDMRGHHAYRPHAMTDEERGLIVSYIQSFRGRVSHYSRKKTRKVYLPEDLNISKMHAMFMEKQHPNVKCSYDSYRDSFNNKFNISFGHPRKDTCTTCDKLKVKLDSLNSKLNQTSLNTLTDFQRRKDRITATLELHQRKGEVLYELKKASRIEAQNN